ncbi:hypothetical protein ACEWY4_027874 [Coilia grayii]|uniref:Uncharacterized protein n=1 Tax=Coilia grayii TaxID=363190 RepID=A0ABD1INE4_9TELE
MDLKLRQHYGAPRERPRMRIQYTNSTLRQSSRSTTEPKRENRRKEIHLPTNKYAGQYYNTRQRQNRLPPTRNRESDTEAMDLNHNTLIRKIYDLIRIFHHRHNVSVESDPNNQPPTFQRISQYLSSIIRPMAPSENTQMQIMANAKNWAFTTQQILVEHYDDCIHKCSQELQPLLHEDWLQAFSEAIKWARRRFKRRLHKEAICSTEALLISLQDYGPAPPSTTPSTPTLAPPPPAQLNSDPVIDSDTIPTLLACPRSENVIREEGSPTLQRLDVALSPHNPFYNDSLHSLATHQTPQTPPPPRANRIQNPGNPGITLEQDLPLDLVDPSFGQGSSFTRISERSPPTTTPPQVEIHVPGGGAQGGLPLPSPVTQVPIAPVGTDFGVNTLLQPIRHIQTHKKLTDWTLTARKKWLILGDSNLSRVPEYNIPDLQVDSYPGATFRHAEAILERAKPLVRVEKVVLAFGILHMEQKPKQTAVKQLQRAIKMAKDKFPHAEVWVPLINYSTRLQREFQTNLTELNAHIKANMPFLPKLPEDLFQTEDKIHWTKPTAKAMFQHWAQCLKLPLNSK